jgi:protein tyrosine phosphatase (PTP) superfamily phosphohydrolase (DUF442 family)
MSNTNALHSIRAFLPLSETLGTSGQPELAHFTAIRDAGYEAVINLLPDDQMPAEEPETVRELGMDYISIRVIWTKPTPENFAEFVRTMQANSHRKLYVHCAANMRVSAFCYLYRTRILGMNEADARADMNKIWHPNEIWSAFIASYPLTGGV